MVLNFEMSQFMNKMRFLSKDLMLAKLLCIAVLVGNAQKGNNALSVNGEITIPFFQNDRGFGLSLKEMYGLGKSGQLTLSAGISKFNSKNSVGTGKVTTRLVPFLLGYKYNFKERFYIEPKLGIGELGGKMPINGGFSRPSVAALFGGLGVGYQINRVTFGVNFLTVKGMENPSAGNWHDKSFHYTGVSFGYNTTKKGK